MWALSLVVVSQLVLPLFAALAVCLWAQVALLPDSSLQVLALAVGWLVVAWSAWQLTSLPSAWLSLLESRHGRSPGHGREATLQAACTLVLRCGVVTTALGGVLFLLGGPLGLGAILGLLIWLSLVAVVGYPLAPHLVGGMYLRVRCGIRPGDQIRFADEVCLVGHIGLVATRLTGPEGARTLVPNRHWLEHPVCPLDAT
jgi:hypothetical protein